MSSVKDYGSTSVRPTTQQDGGQAEHANLPDLILPTTNSFIQYKRREKAIILACIALFIAGIIVAQAISTATGDTSFIVRKSCDLQLTAKDVFRDAYGGSQWDKMQQLSLNFGFAICAVGFTTGMVSWLHPDVIVRHAAFIACCVECMQGLLLLLSSADTASDTTSVAHCGILAFAVSQALAYAWSLHLLRCFSSATAAKRDSPVVSVVSFTFVLISFLPANFVVPPQRSGILAMHDVGRELYEHGARSAVTFVSLTTIIVGLAFRVLVMETAFRYTVKGAPRHVRSPIQFARILHIMSTLLMIITVLPLPITELNMALMSLLATTVAYSACPTIVVLAVGLSMDYAKLVHDQAKESKRRMETVLVASEARKQFLTYVLHEIRNPSHAIALSLHELLAIRQVRESQEARQLIGFMENSFRSMDGIMNSILDFDKIDSGKILYTFRPFTLDSLIKIALADVRAGGKQTNLHVEVDTSTPTSLIGDNFKIAQALSALLSNAIKFAKPGDAGNVTLRVRRLHPSLHGDSRSSQRAISTDLSLTPQSITGRTPAPKHSWFHKSRKYASVAPLSAPVEENNAADYYVTFEDFTSHIEGAFFQVSEVEEHTLSQLVYVHFEVEDNGPGIDPQDKELLFKPYVQLKSGMAVKGGGTGLGLSISKGIVEKHGGCISMRDADPHGCIFSISVPFFLPQDSYAFTQGIGLHGIQAWTFPSAPEVNIPVLSLSASASQELPSPYSMVKLKRAARMVDFESVEKSAEDPMSLQHQLTFAQATRPPTVIEESDTSKLSSREEVDIHKSEPVASGPRRMRFLVVDDVGMNRHLLKRMLLRLYPGADIMEATDGVHAIDIVTRCAQTGQPINGICMDKEMPTMDGHEATKAVRALGYAGRVVGVTGNAMQNDVDQFLQAGADAVLAKPVRPPELIRALQMDATAY